MKVFKAIIYAILLIIYLLASVSIIGTILLPLMSDGKWWDYLKDLLDNFKEI